MIYIDRIFVDASIQDGGKKNEQLDNTEKLFITFGLYGKSKGYKKDKGLLSGGTGYFLLL